MTNSSDNRNKAKAAWQQVRSFATLWLTLVCLGGFVVLVGGPWVVGLLEKLFGPVAAKPRGVITLAMLATLPFAVYLWIQQRKLDEAESAGANKETPVTPSS